MAFQQLKADLTQLLLACSQVHIGLTYMPPHPPAEEQPGPHTSAPLCSLDRGNSNASALSGCDHASSVDDAALRVLMEHRPRRTCSDTGSQPEPAKWGPQDFAASVVIVTHRRSAFKTACQVGQTLQKRVLLQGLWQHTCCVYSAVKAQISAEDFGRKCMCTNTAVPMTWHIV